MFLCVSIAIGFLNLLAHLVYVKERGGDRGLEARRQDGRIRVSNSLFGPGSVDFYIRDSIVF